MNSDSAPILIRPLSEADFEKWLPVWQGYQTFYQATLPRAVTAESFRRMLDPAEPTFGALAWQGEAVMGMVHWIFHRSNWTIGDYCYLQGSLRQPRK